MNYIIFEDKNFKLLSPVIDLHATFELRTGAFNNIDRILYQISDNDSIQLYVRQEIEDIIREKYPNIDVNPKIFKSGTYINGASICYFDDFKNFDKNLSYSNSSSLVTFSSDEDCDSENIHDLIKNKSAVSSKTNIKSVEYLWDIFDILSENIKRDYNLLYNYKNGTLHPSCVLIEEDNIIINNNAEVLAGSVLDASNGPIIIDEGARLDIGTLIKGPVYIGKKSIINPGSKIRGPVSVGTFCKLGGEIEDSVISGFSNKQHDGFLGHSYIGEWVNLGANTNTSDLKNNYSNIRFKLDQNSEIDTKEMFIGSLIGDFSCTSISTKLNTGTYIGTGSNIFNHIFDKKYIAPFSWGDNDKVGLNRFIKTCQIIMARRDKELSEALKNRLITLWKK